MYGYDLSSRRTMLYGGRSLLDQALLEQQRFGFARGQRDLDVGMRATNAIVLVLRPDARK